MKSLEQRVSALEEIVGKNNCSAAVIELGGARFQKLCRSLEYVAGF